ncbi:MAG: metal/formaldehyde-sensitive transcriptional repressor [Proteobacteria bacterium]|nr:metal/formaldehyde-sensitive transcriptional repressor [Pseudomonadota bacterium]
MAHLAYDNEALLKRIRRIAGQVEAIERSLTSAEDCATTLHLVAGAKGAMAGLMEEIVEAHIREHVARAGLSQAERAEGADQLIAVIRRYAK